MKVRIVWFISLSLMLGLVACSGTPASSPSGTPKPAAAAATPASGAATPAAVASKAAAPAKAAALKIGQNAALGQFLTDDQGRTLYVFLQDTGTDSTCYDACVQKWPVLLTQGAATGQTGINASLFGTTQRKDGTTQVTFSGHPLYFYASDQKPGDTVGQGVGSIWYVISPTGEIIKK